LTWPLRAHRFAPVPLPSNAVFSIRGYAILCDDERELLPLLAIGNSAVFDFIFKLALGRFGFPEYVVGVLQKLPLPDIADDLAQSLSVQARQAWAAKRMLDTIQPTSHTFALPAILAELGETLTGCAAAWSARVSTSQETVAAIQAEIDDVTFRLYGLNDADRVALTTALATESTGDAEAEASEEESEVTTADASALSSDLLAYVLGTAFGRWDIRFATGENPVPELPEPFEPLPVCPPGQLQNEQGLPVTKEEVERRKEEGRWDYPIEIPWDGILVDDLSHPLDLEARVHQVLQVIWKDRWEAIEREAGEILGVRTLRDYFRKPTGFFANHLKRYSKSRRQAPIYWPLQTPSGSYTLWLYYHRLNDQTLYTCVNDFVEKSKLCEITEQLNVLRIKTNQSKQEEKDLERLLDLEQELKDFRDELLRMAKFWKPNLNDGVQITAAPLWKLFQHKPWQKTLKETWDRLEHGDYDWAHLAYSIWPDRVREKCKHDKSLSIAHGLEYLYEEPPAQAKRGRARK
jgi:hypothetical protein